MILDIKSMMINLFEICQENGLKKTIIHEIEFPTYNTV